MLTIRAAVASELADVVAFAWPLIQEGQAGYSLAGLASPEALTDAWTRLVENDGDALLLAEDDGELVGACGMFASDEKNLMTVNGPVAARDHADIYDAFVAEMATRYPSAELWVGVSHRHQLAQTWLAARGVALVDHQFPFVGQTGGQMVDGIRSVALTEQTRFKELYDRLIGFDLWWTADRIIERWHEWIVLVDKRWTSVLAARVYPSSTMTEVFAASAPDVESLTPLVQTWLAVGVARGRADACWFCDADERPAAEAVGMVCRDEYLGYALSL